MNNRYKIKSRASEFGDRVTLTPLYNAAVSNNEVRVTIESENPKYMGVLEKKFYFPEAKRVRVRDVFVLFPHMILKVDEEFFFDLCIYRPDAQKLFSSLEPLPVNQDVFLLGNNNFHNYAHFTQEVMPSVRRYKSLDKKPPVVLHHIGHEFQKDGLAALGLRSRSYPHISRGLVHFKSVEFFSFTDHSMERHHFRSRALYAVAERLRTRAGHAISADPRPYPKRLFVSRRDSDRRVFKDTAWLSNWLQRYGFEEVTLSGRPLLEQVNLFAHAEWIVGLHGAGLVNIIYCNPRTRVFEIQPPSGGTINFARLGVQFDLDYYLYQEYQDMDVVNKHALAWSIDDRRRLTQHIKAFFDL